MHFSALTGMQLSPAWAGGFSFSSISFGANSCIHGTSMCKSCPVCKFNTSSIALDWNEDAL